jgi:hypothetical protein
MLGPLTIPVRLIAASFGSRFTPMRHPALCVALVLSISVAGCGDDGFGGGGGSSSKQDSGIDPTPETLDGSPSQEFEDADIERAEEAPEAVQDYCSGAVSEAQEVGCLSHVDEAEIP